ncbi:DUF2059 domain-containing protein [Sphingomicrobium nitratireducens]|uniref:DUF2059 domain-containing protein n=1 Tax=Sphingomicrobium nitratireducens TaxID=2964666 RepID=UPI00223EBF4D|nr:DUF2059 domain-containing protein [Sphingomicrobium nitratireducens]
MKIVSLGAAALALCCASPTLAQSGPSETDLATGVVEAMWPDGTTDKMMDQMFGQMMDQIIAAQLDAGGEVVIEMVRARAEAAGEDPAEMEAMLEGMSVREIMEMVDPHYAERMQIMSRIMGEEMRPIMIEMEPGMKAAFAGALVRHYEVEELEAAHDFFTSPMGSRFANKMMLAYMDPDYMNAMMSEMMPRLMQIMPDVAKRLVAETAHLPLPGNEGGIQTLPTVPNTENDQ